MGSEHRDKGVDVQLGPVSGPLGRAPEGGRNWEGFSPDPVLTGVGMEFTIKGIQDAGVIACAKHYIMNEQVIIILSLLLSGVSTAKCELASSIWRNSRNGCCRQADGLAGSSFIRHAFVSMIAITYATP
jgi:Glycosyl hydrolase family 3 N terminal domain